MHEYNTYNCVHHWKPIHGCYIRLSQLTRCIKTSQTHCPHFNWKKKTPPPISSSALWKVCTLNISLLVLFTPLYLHKYIKYFPHTISKFKTWISSNSPNEILFTFWLMVHGVLLGGKPQRSMPSRTASVAMLTYLLALNPLLLFPLLLLMLIQKDSSSL